MDVYKFNPEKIENQITSNFKNQAIQYSRKVSGEYADILFKE